MTPGSVHVDRSFLWTTAAVFSLLTVLLFWQYALAPATTVSDPGDPLFLMWTLEWVGRTLVRAPLDLFDAPMFHPLPSVLAYSDPLLPQALLAMPLRALGLGPVAAYNVVYLGGIAATGVVASVLFFELTGHRAAAVLGAMVATFPVLRLFHLAHMQLQFTVFLPLAFWQVHRALRRPGWRTAAALGASVAVAALACLYYGMFLALLLPPFALLAWAVTPSRTQGALLALSGAGLLAGLILLPFGVVYRRAIDHLGMERADRGFSDLSHYLGFSPFSDVADWLPRLAVRNEGPQWVGAGAAWLLPVGAVGAAGVLFRSRRRAAAIGEAGWPEVLLPYAVVGCLAMLLSLGPEVRWDGHVLFGNPVGHVAMLPGAGKIRDFQRAGFFVALAGGCLVAVALAALARSSRGRLVAPACGVVALTTLVPAFSSRLPAYTPPPKASLDPAYAWLGRQPEPLVVYEVPLPARGELEPLEYLWAALHHRKRLVHGFSGYLPMTDDALRAEAARTHRPDFFRSLARLGATHLVVHTDKLLEVEGGAASLVQLRDARGHDRVARFPASEIYRVASTGTVSVDPREGGATEGASRPELATGGWTESEQRCVEVGPSVSPLVWYVPALGEVRSIVFLAESPLGEMDDGLLIEGSEDLRSWRPVPHGPLLSTSLAVYLREPAPRFWIHAVLPPAPRPFLRFSSRREERMRLCDAMISGSGVRRLEALPAASLRARASVHSDRLPLAADGDLGTRWHSGALQRGGEWIEIDLDRAREIVAVVLELGETPYDFGRRLTFDCVDAAGTEATGPELEGSRVLFERPRAAQVLPAEPSWTCQRLRVRQSGTSDENFWSVAEIQVLVLGAPNP
jgi:hypothetical protein